MAGSEPPDNAVPLAKAFRQLSDEYAVRLIEAPTRQSLRGRPKWRSDQLRVLAKFFDSLQPGGIWWVRLGGPDGPWVQRDPPPPGLLRVKPEDWPLGKVERLKERVLQTKRPVTTYGRRDGQPWFPPRPHKPITELVVDEVWYDVRIVVAKPLAAPPSDLPAAAQPIKRQPGRPKKKPGETAGERRLRRLEEGICMERQAQEEGCKIATIERTINRAPNRRAGQ